MKIDNGLTFDNQNKGLLETKEDKLDYYTDMYTAGQTKQKLKIGREVEGGSNGGGNIKTGYVSIPSGYTDYAITGIGFKPKAIQVVVYNGNKVAWGSADDIGGTIQQQCIYADGGNYADQNGRLFRFDNVNRGLLVSFDNDGFTVKSDLSAIMTFACFG